MLGTVSLIALTIIIIGFGLALVRVVLGPTLPDRVVGLDLAGSIAAAFVAVSAVMLHQPVLIDVLLGLSMILFFGSTVFARYLQRQHYDDR